MSGADMTLYQHLAAVAGPERASYLLPPGLKPAWCDDPATAVAAKTKTKTKANAKSGGRAALPAPPPPPPREEHRALIASESQASLGGFGTLHGGGGGSAGKEEPIATRSVSETAPTPTPTKTRIRAPRKPPLRETMGPNAMSAKKNGGGGVGKKQKQKQKQKKTKPKPQPRRHEKVYAGELGHMPLSTRPDVAPGGAWGGGPETRPTSSVWVHQSENDMSSSSTALVAVGSPMTIEDDDGVLVGSMRRELVNRAHWAEARRGFAGFDAVAATAAEYDAAARASSSAMDLDLDLDLSRPLAPEPTECWGGVVPGGADVGADVGADASGGREPKRASSPSPRRFKKGKFAIDDELEETLDHQRDDLTLYPREVTFKPPPRRGVEEEEEEEEEEEDSGDEFANELFADRTEKKKMKTTKRKKTTKKNHDNTPLAASVNDKEMRALFRALDKSGDGFVTIRELIIALRKRQDLAAALRLPSSVSQENGSRDRVEAWFQSLDVDADRELSYAEFSKHAGLANGETTRGDEDGYDSDDWLSKPAPKRLTIAPAAAAATTTATATTTSNAASSAPHRVPPKRESPHHARDDDSDSDDDDDDWIFRKK